jgi:hypothetical protein
MRRIRVLALLLGLGIAIVMTVILCEGILVAK